LEYVGGALSLEDCSNLKSLGKLNHVDRWLDLYGCENLQSLGNLEYVGGGLGLAETNVETLGNLEYVGGYLDLQNTPLSEKYAEDDIRKMVKVVGVIVISYED